MFSGLLPWQKGAAGCGLHRSALGERRACQSLTEKAKSEIARLLSEGLWSLSGTAEISLQ